MSTSGPSLSGLAPSNVQTNVEFLMGNARELANAEWGRTSSLDSKATSLIGISGVLLGLTATFGRDLRELHGIPHSLARIAFFIALGALLCAIGAAARVIWPRSFLTLSMFEIQQYTTRGYLSRQPLFVQGTTLRGLVNSIAFARSVNNSKGRWLSVAFASFVFGLVAAVLAAITFVWRPQPTPPKGKALVTLVVAVWSERPTAPTPAAGTYH